MSKYFCFVACSCKGRGSCTCILLCFSYTGTTNQRVAVRGDAWRFRGGSREGTYRRNGYVRMERVGRIGGELSNWRLWERFVWRLCSGLRWSTHRPMLQLVSRHTWKHAYVHGRTYGNGHARRDRWKCHVCLYRSHVGLQCWSQGRSQGVVKGYTPKIAKIGHISWCRMCCLFCKFQYVAVKVQQCNLLPEYAIPA